MTTPLAHPTGRITGTIHALIPATSDTSPTIPDLTAKFTALVRRVVSPGVLSFPLTYSADVDPLTGVISLDGQPWVDLPATDVSGVQPPEFLWRLTITAPSIPTYSVAFDVPAGSVRDLSEIATVEATPTGLASVGATGRGIMSITDTDGDGIATVAYTDGTTSALTLPLALPTLDFGIDAGGDLILTTTPGA